jgi:hypothetical protein
LPTVVLLPAAPCARLDAGRVVGALVIRLRGKAIGNGCDEQQKGRVDTVQSRLASGALAALVASRRQQTTARAG